MLAALALTLAVVADPATFAASRGGVGADTDVAVDLANFLDQPLELRKVALRFRSFTIV